MAQNEEKPENDESQGGLDEHGESPERGWPSRVPAAVYSAKPGSVNADAMRVELDRMVG